MQMYVNSGQNINITNSQPGETLKKTTVKRMLPSSLPVMPSLLGTRVH